MNKVLNKLVICYLSVGINTLVGQEIHLNITDDSAYFLEGMDSVLVYRATETSLRGNFKRSNYIHPLYGLDGEIITEDFPEDHKHHRGIFWAWHQLYVGDTRIGDGWEVKDISWDVISLDTIGPGASQKILKTQVLWKSPLWKDKQGNEKPLVHETNHISVYPKRKNFRLIDIQIELLGLVPDMRLGGSEDEKGYGGFSIRMKLPEDIEFKDKDGTVLPQNLSVHGKGWMTIYGTLEGLEAKTSVTIIPHKDNPGYPNPWILRSKASMQNAVFPHPGAIPIPLSTTAPLQLKYRLLIGDGTVGTKQIERCQDSFFREK